MESSDMPFITIPGIDGRVYVPEKEKSSVRKHDCDDCYSCQMCSDIRCNQCLNGKKGNKGKTGDGEGIPPDPVSPMK